MKQFLMNAAKYIVGHLKDIKTTILGMVINGFVIAWLYKNYEKLHEVPIEGFAFPAFLLTIGVGLLFAPDKMINAMISLFRKKGGSGE